MTRIIHINARTGDAWEEGKHPRAENGEFGAGSGTAKAGAAKRTGQSEYAKKRLEEYDAKRDQQHADKGKRIKLLEGKLKALDPKAPLRDKVAIVKELKSLGWQAERPTAPPADAEKKLPGGDKGREEPKDKAARKVAATRATVAHKGSAGHKTTPGEAAVLAARIRRLAEAKEDGNEHKR